MSSIERSGPDPEKAADRRPGHQPPESTDGEFRELTLPSALRPDLPYAEIQNLLDSEATFPVGLPSFKSFRGHAELPSGERAWVDQIRTSFTALIDEPRLPRNVIRHGFWVWSYAITADGREATSESETAGYAMEITLVLPEIRRERARLQRRQVFFSKPDSMEQGAFRNAIEKIHEAAVERLRDQNDLLRRDGGARSAYWDAISTAHDFPLSIRTLSPVPKERSKLEIAYQRLFVGSPVMVMFIEPLLGIEVAQVSPENAQALGTNHSSGVRVSALAPNGLGIRAGLQVGDVIFEADLGTVATVADFRAAVDSQAALKETTIRVDRGGRQHVLSMRPKNPHFELIDQAGERRYDVVDDGLAETELGARQLAKQLSALAAERFDRVFVVAHKNQSRFKQADGTPDGDAYFGYLKRIRDFAAALRRSFGPDRVALITSFDEKSQPRHWEMVTHRKPDGVLVMPIPDFLAGRKRAG